MKVPLSVKLSSIFVLKNQSTLLVKSNMTYPDRFDEIWEPESVQSASMERDSKLDRYEVTNGYEDGYVSVLDRIIVEVVRMAGSMYMFMAMWIILALWIVLGIVYNAPQTWQIIMQDGQSIQTYIWDTLLMRQQLDDSTSFLKLYGRLKSRFLTHRRLLDVLTRRTKALSGIVVSEKKEGSYITSASLENRGTGSSLFDDLQRSIEAEVKLPAQNWFDKLCTFLSQCLGSLPSVVIYWIGIFVWIGCGNLYIVTGNSPPFTGQRTGSNPHYSKWNDNWQLFINTTTAVVLLITSILLENVRDRNDGYIREQMQKLCTLDCKIEGMARYATGDLEDNEIVEIPPVKRLGIKKIISAYAQIIGTGIGLVISCFVFAIWLGFGSRMNWDSNWWLIIGTFTGLVGFVDGFTLREIYYSITNYEEKRFGELLDDSQELLDVAGIEYRLRNYVVDRTFIYRFSEYVNYLCSNQWSVVIAVVAVMILLFIASALHWSITGQLICNTPTMIIEGFCLLILIQAHNWADFRRRFIVKQLAVSRELLYQHVQKLLPADKFTR
ncbi:hypothetical protein FOA43_004581 [Brettanomyces nanus]|uniref:Low-affinity Fe(2+) transport protein n=1 Tax=Eeniella nana TaxID=13502 RepID=A0A875SAV9_EENNA|nr:uncharacterized protein FOA43_004581 [Brettanomyces nanus]QPG77175.1 hypothetical protein FOA43_004581 [Brettanomyces nanus]